MREEYALSARTTSGLVRGRPRRRGTRRRATTFVKAGASPAWPAVRTNAGGRQRPSTTMWIFVVSPPRGTDRWHGRPALRQGPPFAGPCRVLVSQQDRGVDRHGPVQVLVRVGLGHQCGENSLPGAVDSPHPRPVVDTSPVAVPLRPVHPLDWSQIPGCPAGIPVLLHGLLDQVASPEALCGLDNVLMNNVSHVGAAMSTALPFLIRLAALPDIAARSGLVDLLVVPRSCLNLSTRTTNARSCCPVTNAISRNANGAGPPLPHTPLRYARCRRARLSGRTDQWDDRLCLLKALEPQRMKQAVHPRTRPEQPSREVPPPAPAI